MARLVLRLFGRLEATLDGARITAFRPAMDEQAFAAAWVEGKGMTQEQVVEKALALCRTMETTGSPPRPSNSLKVWIIQRYMTG